MAEEKLNPLACAMEVVFNHFPGTFPSILVQPYEVEKVGNITYTRYTDGMRCVDAYRKKWVEGPIMIFKTEVDGDITRNTKAWDFWKNRATAKYRPINAPMNPGSSYS